MIETLAIAGYRSLRDLRLPLAGLTVVTGANGSGKSSLYRALRLLAEAAQGRIVQSLALEGGLESTLWAGPETLSREMRRGEHKVEGTRRQAPVSLRLGFCSERLGYAIDLGLPVPPPWPTLFGRDPEIKSETLWHGARLRPSAVMASRSGPFVRVRNAADDLVPTLHSLAPFDSMMTHGADPREGADLLLLREEMRGWRFYDSFRTDREAPARRPQIGTSTPVLSSDGADVAAAIRTIQEIGDAEGLDEAVADAFPGCDLTVEARDGLFDLQMHQHGLLRPLHAAELSDGTLRYILLLAALLSPRPPSLMVLNEPETSLHTDLVAPLGRLIARAAKASQVIMVSHAAALVEALSAEDGCARIVLRKELGETAADGAERPAWTWPSR